ncbi:uncharacterized protein LOC143033305 isoform X2 [Oratosquilla oratoria]|uniref:uncharacterized protein LOC143033305 isoform X2 n=1 Tax=Oratosquilla oratoria TaxID=337810 RepID=UPI003F777037
MRTHLFRPTRKAGPFLVSCIILISLTSLPRISLLTEMLTGHDGKNFSSTSLPNVLIKQNAPKFKDESIRDCQDQADGCDDVIKENGTPHDDSDMMSKSQFLATLTRPAVGSSSPPTTGSSDTQQREELLRPPNRQSPKSPEQRLAFSMTKMTRRLWKDDPYCNELNVRFLETRSLPLCALTSFPGSGNTWTRYLIEVASGVFTGSIYMDQQLYAWGYYGELDSWKSGRTVAQKTHESNPTHVKDFNGTGILIIRNPYRAILSHHNFIFGGHTGFAPVSNYRRKDWDSFVHLQTKSWLELALNWTLNADNLLVVFYEDIMDDPAKEMRRVLNFRGLPVSLHRLQCLKNHTKGNFKRNEKFLPEGLEVFSAPIRSKVDRAIRYLSRRLIERGHGGLPVEKYEFYDGAESVEVVRVACRPNEDTIHCDERVNLMNKKRKHKNKAMNPFLSALKSLASMFQPDLLSLAVKHCSQTRQNVIQFDPNDEDYAGMNDSFNVNHPPKSTNIDKDRKN